MGLRDVVASLPPGFRFCPSDDELVCHYLYNKLSNYDHQNPTLLEIDLHMCEPWQLPEMAKLNDEEWYFFSFRDRKYATGLRTNRATTCGYWKATGKDKFIHHPKTKHVIVGMRKTLVFYKNRAPNGIKTGWFMHEFRLEDPHIPPKEDWVLCRVFIKSGIENNLVDNVNNNGYNKNMLIDTKDDQPLCSMVPNPLHILNQSTTALLNLPTVNTSFEFQTFQDQNNVVKIIDASSKYENIHEILLDDVSGICIGDEGMLDQHLDEMGFDGNNNLFFI